MASRRNLKKDIRFLCEMAIIEAIELSELVSTEADKKRVHLIIYDIASLHNNLVARTNHPDGKDNRAISKQYYRSIIDDLMNGCNKAFNELNQITL